MSNGRVFKCYVCGVKYPEEDLNVCLTCWEHYCDTCPAECSCSVAALCESLLEEHSKEKTGANL